MIVIAPSHAHRSLRLACTTECDPGEHANISESSVMIVVVQVIGRGIIGYKQIGPAVIVVVTPDDTKAVVLVGVADSSLLRNFLESAVAFVVEEEIALTLHAPGAALHGHSLEVAKLAAAKDGQMVHVNVDVTGNE